jgi:hypothetical protein
VKIFEKLSAARMKNIKGPPKEQSIEQARQFEPEVTLKDALTLFPSYLHVFGICICNFPIKSHRTTALHCGDIAQLIPRESARVAFV